MEAVQDGPNSVGGEGIRFVYDHGGTRVLKMDTLQSMTAYVNQFYVVQNPETPSTSLATKEIFIGNNRIAAQMTGSAVTTSVTTTSTTNVSPTAAWVGAWGVSLAPGNTDAANFGSPGNFITIEKNNTPVMSANPIGWTQPNPVLGIVNATQIMTLQNPDPSNGYFVVAYGGQTGYVQENAAVVGFPVTISTNNTSLMPKGTLVFFYHTDQIGSTGYMTDVNGTLSEHLEYIPFGETWTQQERGTQVLPNYEFSGKELDTETGLYYFGARYYDPRTSVWESADPILDEYLSGKRNNGVYNSFNLGLYSYVSQNPVLLIDPDGKGLIGLTATVLILGGAYTVGFVDMALNSQAHPNATGMQQAQVFGNGATAGAVGGLVALGTGAVTKNPYTAGMFGSLATTDVDSLMNTGELPSGGDQGKAIVTGLLGAGLGGKFIPTKGRLPGLGSNVFGKNSFRLMGQQTVGAIPGALYDGVKGSGEGASKQNTSNVNLGVPDPGLSAPVNMTANTVKN